jgi:hypothetical protein
LYIEFNAGEQPGGAGAHDRFRSKYEKPGMSIIPPERLSDLTTKRLGCHRQARNRARQFARQNS